MNYEKDSRHARKIEREQKALRKKVKRGAPLTSKEKAKLEREVEFDNIPEDEDER